MGRLIGWRKCITADRSGVGVDPVPLRLAQMKAGTAGELVMIGRPAFGELGCTKPQIRKIAGPGRRVAAEAIIVSCFDQFTKSRHASRVLNENTATAFGPLIIDQILCVKGKAGQCGKAGGFSARMSAHGRGRGNGVMIFGASGGSLRYEGRHL